MAAQPARSGRYVKLENFHLALPGRFADAATRGPLRGAFAGRADGDTRPDLARLTRSASSARDPFIGGGYRP